ncbi:MAG: DNA-3-methyladenine glycosylase I, partial [Sutterellaceae bacterium]|nr:DNA-3-methyladenine glycosylase I [Sutterellaceae bacterium]
AWDDGKLFEFIVLESAQAGLSWRTILERREGYRACFAGFDPAKVAAFTERDVSRILLDPRIIRNRKKVEATVANARAFLELASKHGSFARWFWDHTDGYPIENAWKRMEDVPATTALSDSMAREMKSLGFRFLGSTVLYSHMQACGMVNDHLTGCFRYEEVRAMSDRIQLFAAK